MPLTQAFHQQSAILIQYGSVGELPSPGRPHSDSLEGKVSHPNTNLKALRGLSKSGEQMSTLRSIFPRQFFIARERETSDPVARYLAAKRVQQARTYGRSIVQSR